MMYTAQGLGKIDADLYEKDGRYREMRAKNDASATEWRRLNDSVTQAYLWVLGSYEVIRTLDQRFEELGTEVAGVFPNASELKHKFERVRIPLAKFEAAKRHKTIDQGFAYPALSASHGIGWSVSEKFIVSRSQLSSDFLEFMESLKSAQRDA